MKITFTRLSESHFPQLLQWLEAPHVKMWWDQDVVYTIDLVREKFGKYTHTLPLSANSKNKVYAYIIYLDDQMIGYIQTYNARDFSHENKIDLSAISGSICGIDLFIGNPKFLYKKLGGQIINEFYEQILARHFDWCLVDPVKENTAAIKAFEKIEFEKLPIQNNQDKIWMIWKREAK